MKSIKGKPIIFNLFINNNCANKCTLIYRVFLIKIIIQVVEDFVFE